MCGRSALKRPIRSPVGKSSRVHVPVGVLTQHPEDSHKHISVVSENDSSKMNIKVLP